MSTDVITLEIATPTGMFKGSFPKDATVKEVIDHVAKEQSLDRSDQLELVFKGQTLTPDTEKLSHFGLVDGAQLDLVATGSGVSF